MNYNFILGWILLFSKGLYAQTATLSSGGDFSSESGSVSVSVGEVICSFETEQHRINQIQAGVQQTSTLFFTEYVPETQKLLLYPNPATQIINLQIETNQVDFENLHYFIYGVDGKICKEGNVSNKTINTIDVTDLSTGKYFFVLDELKHHNLDFIKL